MCSECYQSCCKSCLNIFTPQRTVRCSCKDLVLLVYGLADRHKAMHTLTVHFDKVFTCKETWNLVRRLWSKNRLDWKCDVRFRQQSGSFGQKLCSEIKHFFEKLRQFANRHIFFEFPLLNIIQDLTKFNFVCYQFYRLVMFQNR